MKDMFKKLMKFIGLDNSSNCIYNSFIIGNTCYIVLEFDDDKLINKIIITASGGSLYNKTLDELKETQLQRTGAYDKKCCQLHQSNHL